MWCPTEFQETGAAVVQMKDDIPYDRERERISFGKVWFLLQTERKRSLK